MYNFFHILKEKEIEKMTPVEITVKRNQSISIVGAIMIASAGVSLMAIWLEWYTLFQATFPIAVLVSFPKILSTSRLSKHFRKRNMN